jgi:2-polyprenyl-3-methyl-5-hydroxy-6-metoxy-1,4-benzoquinol methylase
MSASPKEVRAQTSCLSCGEVLRMVFADLGVSPLANSYLSSERLHQMERFYPLRVQVCGSCLHVQLEGYESPSAIFTDYAYFSSFSSSWLAHAERYADETIKRFGLNADSRVVEIASNDGYLLQYFHRAGIPVLGIEPAENVAKAAIERDIPTEVMFFDAPAAVKLVRCGFAADLIAANNVLAHVPDIHGFLEGFRILLKPGGVATFEFPHVLKLIAQNQFDTIYHEHCSYFSLFVVQKLLDQHGLMVFDVEELPTHGGSLRVYARHRANSQISITINVGAVAKMESDAGLHQLDTYTSFASKPVDVKCDLLQFLIDCRQTKKKVVGYGAPAKGNTLLNYCGVGKELLPYTVDRSPHKQGLYLPGTHIPIESPTRIEETRPNYVLILPWNLRDEITDQMSSVRSWGGKFVVPIPKLEIF